MSESSGGDRIICRQCGENISINTGNCPHCGTSIRGRFFTVGGIILGVGLFLVSVYAIVVQNETGLWFFALISIVIAVISFVFFRDRRERIQEANEEPEAEA